jgi:hypothetical protein
MAAGLLPRIFKSITHYWSGVTLVGTRGESIVENKTGSLIVINQSHHQVHDGEHYFYSDSVTLSNGESQRYMLTTPDSANWAHLLFRISGSLATIIAIYEGGDRDGTTPQTAYNNNRNSPNTPDMTIHKGASGGTTDGTDIHPNGFGSSTGGGSGGVSERDEEIILKQNTKYIIEMTSSANNNRVSLHLDWYEITFR